MRSTFLKVVFVLQVVIIGCGTKESGDVAPSSGSFSKNEPPNNPGGNKPGVITAGEWNDLNNWIFWDSIIQKKDFEPMPAYWSIFNNNRVSVCLIGTDSFPIVDAIVKLKRDGTTLFSAKTDNKGKAELWIGLFQHDSNIDFSKLTLEINNGTNVFSNIKQFKNGINTLVVSPKTTVNKIELAYVVDATGSMGDELEYLKTELLDVISRVKRDNPNAILSTSSVFYRDEGDTYVTKISHFTDDINTTINFIKDQSAGGGGDYPEAVHLALDKTVNELQWSANSKTRILFLVLDAPPHHNSSVVGSLQTAIQNAAEKGIKIIPITASGISDDTEFLMRFMAMSTNGTYVFITDHSGVGNSHLQATVGPYKVEYLNDLMVRLIDKYAE